MSSKVAAMNTFMFPGQGSQCKGMGGALFDEFPELTRQADEILGYSIKDLCLEDPREELNKTAFTQPAMYVVNALSYYKRTQESTARADFFAGHSLGEFNALLAAECFDFATGLKLVQKRGALMSQIANGAMAAILNATKQEIETILVQNGLNGIDLANYNSPSQIVISGLADEVAKAEACFQQGSMLFVPLNTSGAFHSRFMRSVKEEFRQFVDTFELSDCKTPVIANVTARPYRREAMLENLTGQISSTVRWCESIQYLLALGVESGDPMQFEEVGTGDVLTRLALAIRKQTPAVALDEILTQKAHGHASSASRFEDATRKESKPREEPVPAADKVARWNAKYPIGTRVKSLIGEYPQLETRTQALVLFGHRAGVYIKGYNGYFDLGEIVPA